MKIALGLGAGILAVGAAYTVFKKPDTGLIVGGFNMQYGPYKISRIAKDTTGLDPVKQQTILTFNNYCMGKSTEETKLDSSQALQKIFGRNDFAGDSYEAGLVNCLRWRQDKTSGRWAVDVGATFKAYFDPVNHDLWTSAIIDTTPQVADEIRKNGVDIMALVETSNGIINTKGDTIPHTDNLVKLLENLNKGQDPRQTNYKLAIYSQFTNPAAQDFAQLDRGNALIYNSVSTNFLGSFVIELSSEKRGKVTTRRYPVGLFGATEPTLLVCAAHVSGYAYKDSQAGGDPQNLKVGDSELENVLKVLTQEFSESSEVTVYVNGQSYKLNDPTLSTLLKDMKVNTNLPTVIIGDFNQDFNKYSIEYKHEYRFPTFVPHEGKTVAGRYGFQNGYSLAGKIHPTTGYNVTIDGFLTKNVSGVTLLSKPYDQKNSTSDHSIIIAKL